MRKYFTFAAFVSLALCVALFAMWVRSFWTRTAYEFWRADGLWKVASVKGRVLLDNEPQQRLDALPSISAFIDRERELERQALAIRDRAWAIRNRPTRSGDVDDARVFQAEMEERTAVLDRIKVNQNELDRARKIYHPRTPSLQHALPYPAPVAATAVLPLAWIVSVFLQRRRRSVRLSMGLCVSCGYDLRASGERCPECGRIATMRRAA